MPFIFSKKYTKTQKIYEEKRDGGIGGSLVR